MVEREKEKVENEVFPLHPLPAIFVLPALYIFIEKEDDALPPPVSRFYSVRLLFIMGGFLIEQRDWATIATILTLRDGEQKERGFIRFPPRKRKVEAFLWDEVTGPFLTDSATVPTPLFFFLFFLPLFHHDTFMKKRARKKRK